MNLKEVKKISIEKNIPILRDDSAFYISNFLKNKKIKTLLEIGSALGYSSLYFSSNNNELLIDSIEKNNERYLFCIENIKNKNINFYNECAYDFIPKNNYDCIFLDGPKSKQIILFEKYIKFLNKDGYIIIDNIFLKNLKLNNNNKIKLLEKNLLFKEYLKKLNSWNIDIIDIDDGIAICKRK